MHAVYGNTRFQFLAGSLLWGGAQLRNTLVSINPWQPHYHSVISSLINIPSQHRPTLLN